MSNRLTDKQIETLLLPINPKRVSQDRKGNSHVEAYEIRAHLIRTFGFAGWSQQVTDMQPIFETIHNDAKGEPERVTVAYRAQVRLTIENTAEDFGEPFAVYSEWAMGDAQNFPIKSRGDAHDFAIKTAESQALKRCAMNLGDQFGLGLYNKGSHAALVRATLIGPEAASRASAPAAQVAEGPTEPLAPEDSAPEPAVEVRQTNQPVAEPDESEQRIQAANDIREQALAARTSKELTQIMISAGKQSLNNILVDSATGPTRVALKQLLDNRIKVVSAEARVAS